MRKSYFPAPSLDYPPDGPIVLGSILADPLEPEAPLNDKPVPIDGETMRHHVQSGVRATLRKNRHGSGGLFAHFFGKVGLHISASGDKSTEMFVEFEKLQTSSFEPSADYMKQSLSTPKVQQYLARHFMRKRVLVVTGVKVAYGAQVEDAESGGTGAQAFLGLDGNSVGVPLSVGPQAEASRGYSQRMSFKQSSAFVFAYRPREIRYRRSVPTDKPYRDGALYGVGGSEHEDAAVTEDGKASERALFLSVDDEDITGEDVDLESLRVQEHEPSDETENESSLGDEEEMCDLIIIS